MRPTRRGYVTIAIVVVAMASAATFGARGLNAIAAPGVVALAYGAVQVWRLDPPRVERTAPRRGQQGTSVTVELDFDVDRPHSARVVEAVDDGLEVGSNRWEVSLGGEPLRYDVSLNRRGEQTLGPTTVVSRDVMGLVARRFEGLETQRILVRPPVYPLSGARADELVWLFGGGDDRQEFDFLRRYRRGDPLRDIHWRSSAKVAGDDFVVKEFSADEGVISVRVAAESAVGYADEMAAATASIVAHLLAAGLRVGLATADGQIEARGGAEQREHLLDGLARTHGGPINEPDRRDADVLVVADADGVRVELTDTVVPFSQVAGRPVSNPSAGRAVDRTGGLA